MDLSRYEQETIINFNEDEQTAEVYTYNGKLKRRLAELVQTRPSEIEHVKTDSTGAATYLIPKKWIRINPGLILSDEQRAARAKNLAKINSARK